MFSYWEQQSFFRYGHIVAGAGITGLSTAIELKHRYPHDSVVVLERGIMPAGASTKNAGFACMGSVTELLADLQTMTEQEVVMLFALRKSGLEILRKRLGDHNIGYRERGGFELIDENAKDALNHIDRLNELLSPVNKQAFRPANSRISEFGFSPAFVHAVIENTCEGELHTGMMMRALIDYAIRAGVEIKTGVAVTGFEEGSDHVAVSVKNSLGREDIILKGGTFNICTNAFTKQLLPGEDVIPGRGQVLVTTPIEGLRFKGIFHMDEGYFYFREIDRRILIGGGRNMDFAGEATTEDAITTTIQDSIERKLRDIIIPGLDYTVEQRWSGTMAFGKTKQPIIKAISPRVYGAFRMGGMGVALGSEAARALVALHAF